MRYLILAAALLAACGGGSAARLTSTAGTIVFVEEQGAPGFFGLLGDDGLRYDPVNLPAQFAVAGMRVHFDAAPTGGAAGWGLPVEILDIVETTAPAPGSPLSFDATVTFVPLEGGFYGLVADGGERYDPIDLPGAFQADGMRVSVEARRRDDLASFHMWAPLIEIDHITALP